MLRKEDRDPVSQILNQPKSQSLTMRQTERRQTWCRVNNLWVFRGWSACHMRPPEEPANSECRETDGGHVSSEHQEKSTEQIWAWKEHCDITASWRLLGEWPEEKGPFLMAEPLAQVVLRSQLHCAKDSQDLPLCLGWWLPPLNPGPEQLFGRDSLTLSHTPCLACHAQYKE